MAKGRTNILIGILLLACLTLFAPHADAEPITLDDAVLDTVTAGDADAKDGGGVVIGNSSEAVADRTTELDLSGQAQMEAGGLNLVNSAESAVANTVNIWDGTTVAIKVEDGDTMPALEVNQVNRITQEQAFSATVSGYMRPEAEQIETFDRSGSASHTSRVVNSNDTTDRIEETRITSTTSSAEVDTLLKFRLGSRISFEGNLGHGVAAAGHIDTTFDGGSADIAVVFDGHISASGGGALSADGGLVLVMQVELPEVRVVMDGAGCGVVMGSCSAESTFVEFTHTKTDNSTLDIIENYQSGQSSYSEAQTSIHRSPFELESAKAEYIVIDDSSLELDSDVTLELSESAQKEIEGMNIVNAIGSNVSNAVNVSRTARFESRKATLVLNQLNIVRHGR